MRIEKQQILEEIKRTAQENGGVPLGAQRFFRETGIKESDWAGKFWARWGDALREAGFAANEWTTAFDEEELVQSFVLLMRELGRFPVKRELGMKARSDKNFPSTGVFQRLGSKQQLAAKILKYCHSHSGYEDIVKLCVPIAAQHPPARKKVDATEAALGFVYLVKSGRYYKVGRSNAAGRREYELGIQMPDKLVTIHAIRTDDPNGIEAYWHQRFGAKRKNGEWFELSSTDIEAFKRRKFM